MHPLFRAIISADRSSANLVKIGNSRSNESVLALKIGSGEKKISLIGGMHADEPIGPLFLRYFCGFLSNLESSHPLLNSFTWWIVPHGNPDGEQVNNSWFSPNGHIADLGEYLRHRVRELPGDDLEFGFPRNENDLDARPEARAIRDWWANEHTPFSLHISFHSMSFAGGTWFLLQPNSTWDQSNIQEECSLTSAKLGYVLHDVERNGEKGFYRIAPGFATHPTSTTMKEHFIDLGDSETANKFRPSSMETILSFGGNPLTLVSEIPLFILPGVGLELGPPDPVANQWKEQLALWDLELREGLSTDLITVRAQASGITAVPFDHHMQLQFSFLLAALKTIAGKEVSVIDS